MARLPPSVTVVHCSPLGFRRARKENLLESPPIEALFPFDELIPSANCSLPRGAAFELSVRVRFKKGGWSRWYFMGRFDKGNGAVGGGRLEDAGVLLGTDTLTLKRPAVGFQYRIVFQKRRGMKSPVLRLVAVNYADVSRLGGPARQLGGNLRRQSLPRLHGPASLSSKALILDVPVRSQMKESPDMRRDICSPACVGMVMEYWGTRVETRRLAGMVFDNCGKIYGNWFLNAAAAGALGFDAYVTRFHSMGELERAISSGRPVILTVAFTPGNLKGAPIKRTKGHLIVACGFDGKGNVVVNDPAAPGESFVRRTYLRKELEEAWLLRKRGVAYVIAPRSPDTELRANNGYTD